MNTEVDLVRILKTSTCFSLSGKSTLTYQIGINSRSEVVFQVIANTGGGFWNSDAVPQSSIQKVLDKLPKGAAITSATFRSIYPQKSANSPGFLLAVLKHAGLVATLKDNRRCYELLDPKTFIAEVNALLEASPDLDGAVGKPRASTRIQKATTKSKPKKA